jgi:hypothetical protein
MLSRRAMPHAWIDARPPCSCHASCAWCVALLLALRLAVWFDTHEQYLVNNRGSERESTRGPQTRCIVTGYLSQKQRTIQHIESQNNRFGAGRTSQAQSRCRLRCEAPNLPMCASFLTTRHLLLNAPTSSSVTCSDHDAINDGGGTDGRPVIMIVAISGLAVDGALLHTPRSASD